MIPAFALQGIEFRYDRTPALAIDHLAIETGCITALTGSNGSGKSTLLNLLDFLCVPDCGSIRFFGEVADPEEHLAVRRHIGYVQQSPYLFHLDVAGNVELGLKLRSVPRRERRVRVFRALEQFGLTALARRRASDLSGGEIQKVALARTFVLQPEVLLLDEPFTHLDREFRAMLEAILSHTARKQGGTIVFTGHDRSQADRLADRVCNLSDGRLVLG